MVNVEQLPPEQAWDFWWQYPDGSRLSVFEQARKFRAIRRHLNSQLSGLTGDSPSLQQLAQAFAAKEQEVQALEQYALGLVNTHYPEVVAEHQAAVAAADAQYAEGQAVLQLLGHREARIQYLKTQLDGSRYPQ